MVRFATRFLLVLSLLAFSSMLSLSQVQVGTYQYTTLKGAFDAINAGTHTGNITIQITGSTTESSTAVLMASGNGSANYTSVLIYPTGTYSITGSFLNSLIELRGADNVTIDGRVNQSGTSQGLSLINSYNGAAAVVWLDSLISGVGAGAANNTIKYCNIVGGSATSAYGIVTGSSSSLTTGGAGNDNLTIQNNKISKVYYGIRIYGLSTTYPTRGINISYNTLGNSTDLLGYYGIYVYYATSPSITYNTIQYQNASASSYGMYLYYATSPTVSNNTWTNTTNSGSYYCLYNYYGTGATISNNSVSNLNITSTCYPFYIYYSGTSSLSGNSINNVTNTSSGTFYGYYNYYSDNNTYTGNTVTNVSYAYACYGFYNNYSSTCTYNRNTVTNLRSFSTGGYGAMGIYLYGSSTTGINCTVTNNQISNLTSTNYSTTSTTYNPFGINVYVSGSAGHKIYYNSVNLYGSQSGSNTSGTLSACLCLQSGVTGCDIRDNCFTNSLSGLTGSNSYAIYLYSTANLTGTTLNNNNYYASGTYGNLGYLGSTITSLTSWRTASSQDANSISSNPSYNSNDLLRPLPGSSLLSAGTPISTVSTDFSNSPRSSTAPTIGCYEQGMDAAGPAFSFTPLPNVTTTSNLSITGIGISDYSGVNTTSGTAPRLYYRKTTNANTYNGNTNSTDGWKWVEASNTSSPFSFTLDVSKIYGGVAVGNFIEYFFTSQDLAATPNVSISGGTFSVAPASVNLTSANFPVTGASSYTISAIYSGIYTVGTSGYFTSLTNSGGAFQSIGNGQLSGNVTLQINSDLTSETGSYSLSQWSETGSGNYSITIVPYDGNSRTISGSVSGSLVKINASRVTIDGSYSGGGKYLTFSNTSTSATTAVIHFASSTTSGINNDTLRNCNIANGSYTASNYGIYVGSSTLGSAGDNLDNLAIMNNNIYFAYNGIYVNGTTNTSDYMNISGNNIGSYNNAQKIGFKAIHLQYVNNSLISKNKIFNIVQSSSFDAVYISTGVTNTTFSKNIIKDLENYSTNRASAFYVSSSTNASLTFVNNEMYSIINNGTAGISYADCGFYIAGGSGYNLYYNSVYLTGNRDTVNGTSTPSSPSCCVYIASGLSSINVRNNVFYNAQTDANGSQKSYTIYNAGASTNFGTINNNDYYVTGSQGVFGYFNGSDVTSLAAWQGATGQDGASISTDPAVNSYRNLRPSASSPLLNAGITISGYSDDLLGYTRSATSPTIGAYEQGGEFAPPVITFNALANTALTSNRVLNNFATITDATGVNTTTNPPRLYFKKSTDNNTYAGNSSSYNGWKYVNGSASGNLYSFTIDYSLLQSGNVSVGDVIQYFIIAQDITPNTNTSYANGTLNIDPTNVNLAASNFPLSGYNSYSIVPSISGNYNVGIGQTYTSLTRSGGLFSLFNSAVLTGNVNVYVTSDLTLEDGTVALNEIASEGGTYYISIKPANAINYNITGANTQSLIRLNGTDRISIDGSYNNAGRYLTFNNTNTSGTWATIHIISNATGAKYVTIKNCNIKTGSNGATSFGIYAGESAISTSGSGADNDNLTIQNNVITTAYYGIYARGTSAGMLDTLVIANNIIGSNSSTDYINYRGMDLQYATSPVIKGNSVFNLQVAPSTNVAAIDIGGTFTDAMINNNNIYSIKNPNSGGWGAYGINIQAGTNVQMINNFISDITTMNYSNSSTLYNPFAIRIMGGTNHKIWNNTINMGGVQPSVGTTATFDAAVFVGSSTITGLDIRNNIFLDTLSGTSGTKSYAIFVYSTTPTSVFNTINYNNYFAGSTYGVLAGYGTAVPFTDLTTIPAIQSSLGQNANSVNVQPYFISNTDLHLNGSAVGNSQLYTTPITTVTTDYDNETRRTSFTYMGADEVRPILSYSAPLTVSPAQPFYCSGSSNVTIYANPAITGYNDAISRTVTSPAYTYTWYKNGTLINGAGASSISFAPVAQTDSANYSNAISFSGENASGSPVPLNIQSALLISSQPQASADLCSTDPMLNIPASASGTITGYQWQKEDPNNPGTYINVSGQTTNTLSIPVSDSKKATGNYRLVVMGPGNCGSSQIISNISTVRVTDPITNIKSSSDMDLANICTGVTFHITATASGTVNGFTWQKFSNGAYQDLSDNPTYQNQTLEIRNASQSMSGKYRCMITGSPKCNPTPVPSADINVVVWPLFEISQQPKGKLLCKGDSIWLTTIADGTIYGYQWYKDDVALDPAKFLGAQKPLLILSNVDHEKSGVYTCILDIQDCSGRKFVKSEPALVYALENTKITTPPANIASKLGGTATFSIEAHVVGAPDSYNADIQWYRGNQKLIDNDRVAGSNSSIMTIKDVKVADLSSDYWVTVSGLCSSDTARYFGIVLPTFEILQQPVSQTICEKSPAVLSVKANTNYGNDKIHYQWYKGTTALNFDAKFEGVNTNKLTILNANFGDNGSDYYCLLTLEPTNEVLSTDTVSITVLELPKFTLQPPNVMSVNQNTQIRLAVNATGAAPLSFQWYFNGQYLPGKTDSVLIIPTAQYENSGNYYCKASNPCGTTLSQICNLTVIMKIYMNVNTDENQGPVYNQPNPFSAKTTINFTVNYSGYVKLSVKDIYGKEVAIPVNSYYEPGDYKIDFDAVTLNLSSGTYYYSFETQEGVITRKMILIK